MGLSAPFAIVMICWSMCTFVQLSTADTWGFLVAASKTWENYRHQSDVAHAYRVLISRGVPVNNIVTFSYDDLAQNPENPYPGKLFNVATGKKPGVDVYNGLKIDYNLGNVTAANVISAMTCDGKLSGPCLNSTAEDNIFIYWAGHGDDQDGLIMPDGGAHESLKSETLVSALELLHSCRKYRQLVFYLEACDGGSIFAKADSRLAAINVLAVAAAKPGEPSYPMYCCDYFKPPGCTVNGQDIGACLGDMFSIAWMTDSEQHMPSETLQEQFQVAKAGTAPVHGNPGSTVMSYGAVTLPEQKISNFEGSKIISGERNKSGDAFNLEQFLAEGRVTPTTPWVLQQGKEGGVLFQDGKAGTTPAVVI